MRGYIICNIVLIHVASFDVFLPSKSCFVLLHIFRWIYCITKEIHFCSCSLYIFFDFVKDFLVLEKCVPSHELTFAYLACVWCVNEWFSFISNLVDPFLSMFFLGCLKVSCKQHLIFILQADLIVCYHKFIFPDIVCFTIYFHLFFPLSWFERIYTQKDSPDNRSQVTLPCFICLWYSLECCWAKLVQID